MFINFIVFFFKWEKYFFNRKFLMKLDGMFELNKFEFKKLNWKKVKLKN